ncbi:UNVERIFIED_ORG: hypothetical protein ABIB52_004359 [Arthrobacter sp. UYCu721]
MPTHTPPTGSSPGAPKTSTRTYKTPGGGGGGGGGGGPPPPRPPPTAEHR